MTSQRTVELLLKAHVAGGCERGESCEVVAALQRRLHALRLGAS